MTGRTEENDENVSQGKGQRDEDCNWASLECKTKGLKPWAKCIRKITQKSAMKFFGDQQN